MEIKHQFIAYKALMSTLTTNYIDKSGYMAFTQLSDGYHLKCTWFYLKHVYLRGCTAKFILY